MSRFSPGVPAKGAIGGVLTDTMAGRACPVPAGRVETMHVASTTEMRRRFGKLAVAAALAALPVPAEAVGGEEPAQREREVREEREVRRFDLAGGGSYIGITVHEVDGAAGGATAEEGAIVTDVRAGGPAAAAGVEAGDVVVEFDGERVRSTRQLARLVQETPAGRTVPAAVLRDGERVTLTVTPEERRSAAGMAAELPQIAAWIRQFPLDGERMRGTFSFGDRLIWRQEDVDRLRDRLVVSLSRRARLGIQAESVSGQLAEHFGVSTGVLVSHVEDDTVAAAAGLQAGDVITAIDGEAVGDLGTLRRRLAGLDPGASFAIAVMRDGGAMSLAAELAEEREDEQRPRPLRRGSPI